MPRGPNKPLQGTACQWGCAGLADAAPEQRRLGGNVEIFDVTLYSLVLVVPLSDLKKTFEASEQ